MTRMAMRWKRSGGMKLTKNLSAMRILPKMKIPKTLSQIQLPAPKMGEEGQKQSVIMGTWWRTNRERVNHRVHGDATSMPKRNKQIPKIKNPIANLQ